MNFFLRVLVNAAALWAAVHFVSGIHFTGSVTSLLVVALIFGVLNAIVRPVLFFFSLPLVIFTLGLFTFVLNALVLMLLSAVSSSFGLGFAVSGFGSAFWGAMVVSCVSFILSLFVRDSRKERPERVSS